VSAAPPDDVLLEVRDLVVEYPSRRGAVQAVDGVDLDVRRGERVGIVGESGSGKSTLAFAILRLLRAPGRISRGSIRFEGVDLVRLDEAAIGRLRGARLAMVYQDPFTYLNPVMRVGAQVAEVLALHRGLSRAVAREAVVQLFARLDLPDPTALVDAFPHQLSGGQRQRVVIAMAVALQPALLVADEPTTALDVTVQAQILRLLESLVRDMGASLILISHDLGVVRAVCDRVCVMRAGRVVEVGAAELLLRQPRHPYTRSLLDATERLSGAGARPAARTGGETS
jgi:ABC-type dipeptide/oligopeptide/nickel transport system ATPase component